jgi:hypothetical protein
LDHIAKANAALEKRKAKLEERKRVVADASLTEAEKRTRVEAIDLDMEALALQADGHVREAEHEALNHRAAGVTAGGRRSDRDNDPSEWRTTIPSREEYRATPRGWDRR